MDESPHGAGHGSIGAPMGDPLTSPGDPSTSFSGSLRAKTTKHEDLLSRTCRFVCAWSVMLASRSLLTNFGTPPVFYLHAWIDKLWWDWKALDLDSRLTEMGGRKEQVPGAGFGFGVVPDGASDVVPAAPGSFAPPSSFLKPSPGDLGGPGGFGLPPDGPGAARGFGGPGFAGFSRPDDLPCVPPPKNPQKHIVVWVGRKHRQLVTLLNCRVTEAKGDDGT
jgi:hypothetical protein